MKNFKDFTIYKKLACLEALKQLDHDCSHQTLFVVDEKDKMIGTVTDGDVRRGFIKGLTVKDEIYEFCNTKFNSVHNEIKVDYVKKLKKDGIRLLPKLNEEGQIEKVFDLTRLKSILPVHAVLMAGGRGERLRPLTDNLPKPMLPLGNKPIIEHNIDHLITYGIECITISVNYLKEKIIEYFGDGSSKGIAINYIEETDPLGTIGCISKIENMTQEGILVLNSDLFTNIDFEEFYFSFETNEADMAVASIPYSVDIPYAIVELKESSIINCIEKPKNTYYANAGIYLIRNGVLKHIPKNSFFNATDLMQTIISGKGKIIHSPIIGYWIDIGMIDDYNKAKEIVKHL